MEHPSRRICTDKIVLEECLGHIVIIYIRPLHKRGAYMRSLQKRGVFRASVLTIVMEKLDSEGCRVAVKYYSDDWPTNSAKESFDKYVFTKTQKTNACME
ncbi:coatomer subunit zeta-1-like protein, partial [Tanacetum coccineum]